MLGISHMQVKAHVRRQDPSYVGPSPRTQDLKNILAYTSIELRMHESKLRTQARAHVNAQTKAVLRHFQAYIIQNQS